MATKMNREADDDLMPQSSSMTFSRGVVEHETIMDPDAGEVRCFRDAQGQECSASALGVWALYQAKGGSWVPINPREPQVSDLHRIAVQHHRVLAERAAA